MRNRIAPQHLQPGLKLPGHLYASNGRVLVRAGTTLGADQLVLVTEFVEDGLYGDEHWPEEFTSTSPVAEAPLANSGKTINVNALKSGMRLTQDIYDAKSDVLLLAAGFQITPRFLRLLASRGIKSICVRPRQDRSVGSRTDTGTEVPGTIQARALDALLEDELKKRIPFRDKGPTDRPRLAIDDLKGEAQFGVEEHDHTKEVVAGICESLGRGRNVSGSDINEALANFVTRASMDIDLLPLIVSLHNAGEEYLFDHSVNVALLSMSMAAQAGLPSEKITEVGFGGLLQDIGMLRITEDIRLAPRSLIRDERREVDRHPLYSIEWLSHVDLAPLTAGLIIYQSHERSDGEGFPRNQCEARIHPFAKIVGMADTYAALTCERPYRPAYRPYEASKEILSNIGRFDRSLAKLFLDTIGLFPIGSLVELNNGNFGQVIRTIPGAHTRPVVEQVDASGNSSGRLINLAVERDLKVVRAYHGSGETEAEAQKSPDTESAITL
ncbi:MAG: HD-GYP domain-containing protein [Planctomycetota bacterium]|jgi:HD-GYP domain-containing protein (c-di-GMP phosphodiesterase class II)